MSFARLRPCFLFLLVVCTFAAAPAGPVAPGAPAPQAELPLRFLPVDVYLNAGAIPLAAYQLELTAKDAAIVGIEGGESPAFRDAPFYDPAALQHNRVILAAFSTARDLPAGDTRVARLHFAITGGKPGQLPDLASRLFVATDAQGNPLHATLEFRPFHGDAP